MFRTMMKSKIHKATVTEANLQYVGSITIDIALMEAADILPNEKVQVVNNNNGARIETYVIEGERNSGVICLNGAAARQVQIGDQVIIISYAMLTDEAAHEAGHVENIAPKGASVLADDHCALAHRVGIEEHGDGGEAHADENAGHELGGASQPMDSELYGVIDDWQGEGSDESGLPDGFGLAEALDDAAEKTGDGQTPDKFCFHCA